MNCKLSWHLEYSRTFASAFIALQRSLLVKLDKLLGQPQLNSLMRMGG